MIQISLVSFLHSLVSLTAACEAAVAAKTSRSHLRCTSHLLQDIPRTTDHAPTKTIYTWKVDLAAAATQLATNMIKGVCNLQDRLQTELNKRHQVQELMLFPFTLPQQPVILRLQGPRM